MNTSVNGNFFLQEAKFLYRLTEEIPGDLTAILSALAKTSRVLIGAEAWLNTAQQLG